MTRLAAFMTSLLPSADLPLASRFYIGAVVILTFWTILSVSVFLAPILLPDLTALFREAFKSAPTNVVDIQARRRQLDAAAGRRAS